MKVDDRELMVRFIEIRVQRQRLFVRFDRFFVWKAVVVRP